MENGTIIEELDRTENAMRRAASKGNTAELRSLKQRKRSLERQAELESLQAQSKMRAAAPPPVEAPGRGEEKRLAQSERDLASKLNRLQVTRDNDLVALNRQPESDSLLSKLEDCESQIKAATRELEGVHVRQAQIAQWLDQQQREARRQQETQDRKSLLAEQRQLEGQAASMANAVTSNWTQLLSSLTALDGVEVKLKKITQMKQHCPSVQDARIAISKSTNNAIRLEDGGRYPDKWIISLALEVKNGK